MTAAATIPAMMRCHVWTLPTCEIRQQLLWWTPLSGSTRNVFVERLWRTVKYEEVYLRDFTSPREARQGLDAYFLFYNE
jgi:hypothetical protein